MKDLSNVFESYKKYIKIIKDFEKVKNKFDDTKIEFMKLLQPTINNYMDKKFSDYEFSYIDSLNGSKGVRLIWYSKEYPESPHFHYIELKDLMEFYEGEIK